jgi:hypothetical protein
LIVVGCFNDVGLLFYVCSFGKVVVDNFIMVVLQGYCVVGGVVTLLLSLEGFFPEFGVEAG